MTCNILEVKHVFKLNNVIRHIRGTRYATIETNASFLSPWNDLSTKMFVQNVLLYICLNCKYKFYRHMSLVTKGVHAKDSLLSNGYKYPLYVEKLFADLTSNGDVILIFLSEAEHVFLFFSFDFLEGFSFCYKLY